MSESDEEVRLVSSESEKPEEYIADDDAPLSKEELRWKRRFHEHQLDDPAKGIRLRTGPIDELYTAINNAVINRRSGIWAHGASGDGKTSSIIAITQKLERHFMESI